MRTALAATALAVAIASPAPSFEWRAAVSHCEASRGQLLVNGQNVAGVSRSKVPAFRRQIGMVVQDHKLLHDRTIFDNVALPLIIAGVGLLSFKPWARILAIIISILNLLQFPFGTALGFYGIWVLFSRDGQALFEHPPASQGYVR